MDRVHEKIAKGVMELREVLNPGKFVIPIGFDGVVLKYLIDWTYSRPRDPNAISLMDAVDVSSKHYAASDLEKFTRCFRAAGGAPVYALDLRTQSGDLVRKLKSLAESAGSSYNGMRSDFRFVAMFDSGRHADMRIFEEELPDEERIMWTDRTTYSKMMYLDKQGHHYDFTPEQIGKLPDVMLVKRMM